MDKPMTTADFFYRMCDLLKEKNLFPEDFLDYSLGTHKPVSMLTYEYNICNNLDYGNSEGIYLDLGIQYYDNGRRIYHPLGTFKTLDSSRYAMKRMAQLLADFIVEERDYVDTHLDDFTWTGYDIYGIHDDGCKDVWGYSCATKEQAQRKKEDLFKTYATVSIRDNATRKENIYHRDKNASKKSA